ncbi:MAG: metallopeptidase family protein [Proteobacteria bacterium]|nr:metallopeptidase family protein [Pseudomonadota bacterium]
MARDRTDRLEADLERGFAALEEGRIPDAEAALERCKRIDRKSEGVLELGAAVADAVGDVDAAIENYTALVELRPDDPVPRLCIARLQLEDLDDPDAALETLEKAFDFIDEEADLLDGIMLRTSAHIHRGDVGKARDSLSELTTSVIDDPHVALDLAELSLAAEDADGAKKWIETAQKDAPAPIAADALHMLARVHEFTGDKAAMTAAYVEVRAMDLAGPPPELEITEDEVAEIAGDALHELPERIRKHLDNVPILIEDVPSEELVKDGVDPRILGLFQGTPMPETGGAEPVVTNIHLYRRNLAAICADDEQLAAEIRITLIHETAHYFGLDDDDLEELGLD